MKIQCLVTMFGLSNEEAIRRLEGMNLFCETFARNQCGKEELITKTINGQTVHLICANDIGTSKNRNQLLQQADADYLIFADDDVVFATSAGVQIERLLAKWSFPNAIAFNVHITNPHRQYKKYVGRDRSCRRRDVMQTGAWRFVVKRVIAQSFGFDETIGPGTEFPCGEDSVFVNNLLKARPVIITETYIATVAQNESTWANTAAKEQIIRAKGYTYKKIYGPLYPVLFFRFLLKTHQFSLSNLKNGLRGARCAKK